MPHTPIRSFGFAELVIPHARNSSVLLLAQKKRTKEKGSLKSFLGLTFCRLPTQYNSSPAHRRAPQTVLLTYSHSLRSQQNVTLFPKKIWRHCSPCGDIVLIGVLLKKNYPVFLESIDNYYHLLNLLNESAGAKPEMARTAAFLVAPIRLVQRAPKKAEVGISGALFWFIFWASKK